MIRMIDALKLLWTHSVADLLRPLELSGPV